mmetsp:Transcript_70429/g.206008  ORF Transcript_70429/g.206008 Transcript_70429/m.206008 type:complete len:616 (+) Transcript_70429:87-1934(+)
MVVWAHEAGASRPPLLPEDGSDQAFLRHIVANAAISPLPHRVNTALTVLEGAQPMSPALRCVVSLTTLFFSVYIAAVLARGVRVVAGFVTEKQLQPTRCERVLAEATHGLSLVPMLCVLMISIRLRAMQLGLPNGDPPSSIQLCMYIHTAAFLLRFLLDIAGAGARMGDGLTYWLLRTCYFLASLVLYGGAAVIVVGIVALRAGPGGSTPALSVTMQCMTMMAVSYILECLVLETLTIIAHSRADAQDKQDRAGKAKLAEAEEEGVGLSERRRIGEHTGSSNGGMEMYDKLVKALTEERPHTDIKQHFASDSTFFHFPLMLCVLLVGISLRSVQLHLQPEFWACIAMYVTTCAIVTWAIWGVAATVERVGLVQVAPSCLHRLGFCPDTPASPDRGAGCPKVRRSVSICLSVGWVFLMAVIYSGTALIVASVFAMEAKTFSAQQPEAKTVALFWMMKVSDMFSMPAISTAMHCVMLLTVMYFGVHLCLMMGRVAQGAIGKWAGDVLDGVQRSLVFVPMLCVMMIAVRMRAMQLKIRDPQPWAQTTMCIAASAIAVQVGCSLCFVSAGDSEVSCFSDTLAGKIVAIVILALRHAAAAALYLGTAALVVALLFMEPGP